MEKKKPVRRSAKRDLDKLQIEEYMANNRHGPGDHSITGLELLVRLSEKPKD